jgi:hypothetical protein
MYTSLSITKCPARDLVFLVVLEERGVPEDVSDTGSTRIEGRAYVVLLLIFWI